MLRSRLRNFARIIGLAAFAIAPWLLSACQSESVAGPKWPPLGREDAPFNIDPDKLPIPQRADISTFTDPYYSPLRPWQLDQDVPADLDKGMLHPVIIMRHYAYVTVAGHYRGSGTYVYFLPDEGIFYLYGDCHVDHLDGMVGPFAGDPRAIMAEAGSQMPGSR